MLNFTLSQTNGVPVAHLTGMLDETADFMKSIGNPPAELIIYCSGVDRVNSQGVKAWIVYFQRLQQRGTKLELHECSPAIVQCLNDYQNFACGGRVASIQIPYFCRTCKTNFNVLATCDSIREHPSGAESHKCPGCGAAAVIDDDPESYFHFLSN